MKQWDAKLSHKVVHTVATIFITLALVAGGAYAYNFFKNDTQTTMTHNPGKALVSTVKGTNAADQHFDEPSFSFNLPVDWKKTGELTTGPYHKFSYQATQKNADNRYLDVYLDGIPTGMAVNKEVAVHAEDSKLTHGEVSANCADFTSQTTPKKLALPAKWDGVDFLCDMDSTGRNVVGTSAPGTINKVELENTGFTKHDFFFVYTDNNYNPDYGIFYNFLDSFTVK